MVALRPEGRRRSSLSATSLSLRCPLAVYPPCMPAPFSSPHPPLACLLPTSIPAPFTAPPFHPSGMPALFPCPRTSPHLIPLGAGSPPCPCCLPIPLHACSLPCPLFPPPPRVTQGVVVAAWSRWLTEEGESGLDKSFIPFGGGARKCMGYNFAFMEIKVGCLPICTGCQLYCVFGVAMCAEGQVVSLSCQAWSTDAPECLCTLHLPCEPSCP